MIRSSDLAYLCPIRCIENNLLISRRADVTLGFSLQLPAVFSLTAEAYDHMHQGWLHLLKRFEEGMLLHKQDIFYQRHYTPWEQSPSYTKKANKWYYMDRPILYHESYVFITIPLDKQTQTGPEHTLFTRSRRIAKQEPWRLLKSFKGTQELIAKVKDLQGNLLSGLQAISGLQARQLTTKELASHLYRCLTMKFEDTTPKSLHVQPIINNPEGMYAGNYNVRLLSLCNEGEAVSSSVIPQLLPADSFKNGITVSDNIQLPCSFVYPIGVGLPIPHIVNTFIEIKDNEKVLAKLKAEAKQLGIFVRIGDEHAMFRRAIIENFIESVHTGSHQLCHTGVNIVLFEENIDKLNHYSNVTENAFASMGGTTCFVERENTANLFFASLPGNSRDHYRNFIHVLGQAICYLPQEGHYLEDKEGTLFVDRFGKPVTVNLWDQPKLIENRNKIIIGPSGTGKSFLINHLVSESLYQGNHVVILDIGGSYKRNCALHGGKYYELSKENPLAFNIFLGDKDQERKWQLDNDKINFIASVIITIWKGDDRLSKEGVMLLKEMITHFYESLSATNNAANLTNFYGFVKKYRQEFDPSQARFFDFDSFALVLKPFASGQYAHLLNARENIDLANEPFIVFDLAGIKKDKTVYAVVSIIIIELLLEKLKKHQGVRKSFIIDECWEIMRSNLKDFIEYMYRTIRKRQGEVYIATQGAEDIRDAAIGPAMINNTDTFMVLDHTKNTSSFPVLQQTFGLTDQDIAMLASMDNSHSWKEVFIKMGTVAKVYRLDVSAHTAAVYTSKAEEVKQIEALRTKFGGNMGFAIHQYIENKFKK